MDLDVKHHMTLWERYAGNSDHSMNFSKTKYNLMCTLKVKHTSQIKLIQSKKVLTPLENDLISIASGLKPNCGFGRCLHKYSTFSHDG